MKAHPMIERRSDAWKQCAESGSLVGQPVRKDVSLDVKAVAGRERTLEFVITTSAKDRDGDVVESGGAVVDAYMKNPVVLWAHDNRQPPVARAIDVKVQKSRVVTVEEFTPADLNPFGHMIYRMYAEGFLNASSIGFRPLDMEPMEDDERSFFLPMRFTRWELLENSKVPVPANPEALLRAHEKGIDTTPLRTWCEQMLDATEPLRGLATSDVERAWKAVAAKGFVIELSAPDDTPAEPASGEGDDTAAEPEGNPADAPKDTEPAAEPEPETTPDPAPETTPPAPQTAAYERLDDGGAEGAWLEAKGTTAAQGDRIDLGAHGTVVVRTVVPGDPPRLYVEPYEPGPCPACKEDVAADADTILDARDRAWHTACLTRALGQYDPEPSEENVIELEEKSEDDTLELDGVDSTEDLSALLRGAVRDALAR